MILNRCQSVTTEVVMLEKVGGRVVAEAIQAQYSIPHFRKSPLDGYAFYAEDTAAASKENPISLKVTEEVAAGGLSQSALSHGSAVKILTGAPIPDGANAVAKYEDTVYTDCCVSLYRPYRENENIIPIGEDIIVGTELIQKGEEIEAAAQGLLAAQGICEVSVYRKVSVGIISQGNELIPIEQELIPGKIHDTNRYMIESVLQKAGVIPSTILVVEPT